MSEYDEAPARGVPWPVIWVLLGCAVLAAGALLVPQVAPGLSRIALIGGGAVAGVVLWLLALAGGLRRAPLFTMIGSLVLLAGGGALAGMGAARTGHAGTTVDASTFAELGTNPDGTVILPSQPARGAISAAYVAAVRADAAAAKDYGAKLAALNIGVLNSPYLLMQAPGILAKCGEIDALDGAAVAASAQRAERESALVKGAEESGLPDDIRRGIAMIAAPLPEPDPLLAQERESLKATGELCRLLAKRGWSNAGGYFGFASAADRTAFDAIGQRRLTIEGERGKVQKARKAKIEEGRELVRGALS
jgi:hypothetical protein